MPEIVPEPMPEAIPQFMPAAWLAVVLAFALALLAMPGNRALGLAALLAVGRGHRRNLPLLAAGWASGIATSLAMAGLGGWVAVLFAPRWADALAGSALLLAAVRMALARAPAPPREPTFSLGAATLVLGSHQLLDPPRLAIFALAAAGFAPSAVGTGAALATAAGVAAACTAPRAARALLRNRPLRAAGIAGLVIAAAALAITL